ncbi:sensor domain-containing protein [Mycobacterium branderi]|uniref:sensor domain-containing protein n=1 Tax=Mycobacterium branderi TaxID=43348 RepID=UPI0013D86D7F|nr:sensor domain-containing protein [Mycobacterium branderi]MCV7236298.1 sensor domain-containing protein [Mycobacterium branderi]
MVSAAGRMVSSMLVVLAVGTGCTNVVAGAVRPAPGITPRPLTGDTVKQVLLDNQQLGKMFDQSYKDNPNLPPRFGGANLLYESAASPPECTGVTSMLTKDAYADAKVEQVADESWWNASGYEENPAIIAVHEAVIALPGAGAADTAFATASEQWHRCDGRSVRDRNFDYQVSNVRAVNSVVAATVADTHIVLIWKARAVGVRVNCLVDVEVTFFSEGPGNDKQPRRSKSADINTAAIDVAHAMMNKVSALS